MKAFRLLFPIVLLCLAVSLDAQTTGDIRGIVTDPSAAAVPGARVSLTNQETGETRNVATDNEGRYRFNLLKIGDYMIAVEAQGFRGTSAPATARSADSAAASMTPSFFARSVVDGDLL